MAMTTPAPTTAIRNCRYRYARSARVTVTIGGDYYAGRQLCWERSAGAVGGFVVEEPGLAFDPASVAGQLTVRPDDPVAGDDDGHRVAPIGQPDGARGLRAPDPPGQLAVADRLAVGNVAGAATRPRRWNSVPSSRIGISNSVRSPSK